MISVLFLIGRTFFRLSGGGACMPQMLNSGYPFACQCTLIAYNKRRQLCVVGCTEGSQLQLRGRSGGSDTASRADDEMVTSAKARVASYCAQKPPPPPTQWLGQVRLVSRRVAAVLDSFLSAVIYAYTVVTLYAKVGSKYVRMLQYQYRIFAWRYTACGLRQGASRLCHVLAFDAGRGMR